MEFENLLLELANNGVLTITINREDKLNALNSATMEELNSAFQRVYDEPEIKAVVITGKGQKAFVAGADIAEISELTQMNGRKFAERGQEIFAQIENCPKPVVAAVNGYALGGGSELAMACHIRVASENAKFGLPEVSLGLIPGYGGTQRLTQLVGKGKAFEMIMTGDIISAAEAKEFGLVNHVVPVEEVVNKSVEIIDKILSKASVAISHVIDCINLAASGNDGFQNEANAFGNCCGTEDFKEGTSAFLQKRKPIFTGK
ncbi:enoyl-CoA hydratase/isomerase family protein [Sediminitomix flava]|uniref:Enoyl-CoA hydratase n=1 Tax=Sediminitomix flava TaxID=379075 RepID=A0A315Z990_SEDFL|nr:enoyl-CoA hydratase-related protein [Sediminitomix flava]PWJ42136.1 enoyl-CoA hydratase [Sediminitomix flava]